MPDFFMNHKYPFTFLIAIELIVFNYKVDVETT